MKQQIEVLHVEDDEATSLLIQVALSEICPDVKYHRVAAVADGLRFLETTLNAPSRLPDLVLLDLNLPRTSGFEMLRFIRASAELSGLCTVVLTASAAADDHDLAMALGASAYIVKPLFFEDYLPALRGAIELAAHSHAV